MTKIDTKSTTERLQAFAHPTRLATMKELSKGPKCVTDLDRLYRIRGDESGILCANFTEEVAAGAMQRVAKFAHSMGRSKWIGRRVQCIGQHWSR